MKITLPAITPGEWKQLDENFIYALNEDGTNRFDLQVRTGYARQAKGRDWVNKSLSIRTSGEEISANTQAISALPELLHNLSKTLEWLNNMDGTQILMKIGNEQAIDIIEGAKKALLKAGATIED